MFSPSSPEPFPPTLPRRHAFALGLTAILLAGALLRLWRLGEPPFGFHTDEGHYAVDAWRIVQGARPIFLERNNGREPVFVYFMAINFPSSALLPGAATNHLLLVRRSGLTHLYANGQMITMITDTAAPAGRGGLYGSAEQAGFEAQFDAFRWYGMR